MSKKKTLVPKLRFPEFRDAGEWEEKFLGSICDILNNKRKPVTSSNRDKGIYPYYGASGIVDYVKEYIFDERILLVGEDGAKWGTYEKTAFIVEGKCWVNNHAHVLRPQKIKDTLLENYLVKLDIGSFITGAAPPKLTLQRLKSIPVPVPNDVAEQKKIADCLSSIDELISAQDKKIESLKAHKKGLMQQLFPAEGETVPKLRFPEFRDAGEWEMKKLEEIAKPIIGKATKANNILTLSSEHGIINQGDYFGRKIAGTNTNRYTQIILNDFVYNDRTTKLFTYGTIKRLSQYQDGIVSPIYKCFRFNPRENPFFWEWYFESGTHEYQLHNLINEGARAGRFNISIRKFLSIEIFLPSLSEQKKIADCLSFIDELISVQDKKIASLKAHKKGLMQQLFPATDEMSA